MLAWKEDPAGLVQRLRSYEALLGEANGLYILRYGQSRPQSSRGQQHLGGRWKVARSGSCSYRKQPELALLCPELLADRLLQLRHELSTADLIATVRQHPWILLLCMKVRFLPECIA